MKKGKRFTEKAITRETTRMADLFALLYYHFGNSILDELGERKGSRLIERAVRSFALDRGRRMRRGLVAKGKKPNWKNLGQANDLPEYTFWNDKQGRTHCPFADIWEEKGRRGQRLGLLYCNTNDPWKLKGYNPNARIWRWVKNRNLGDKVCDGQEYI